MTREEYGSAYQKGFNLTVRFLVSRGLPFDSAQETAQAAWAKGWERLAQLRDPSMVLTWMNSIALNIHRSYIRREPLLQTLPEIATAPKVNLAAIDVRRILVACKQNDRIVLHRHYIEGFKVHEIAQQQGWTETAVRIRLLRARRSVGKRLGHRPAGVKLAAQNNRRTALAA
jgi:RNA polymerase sigma factor (sigma-70 family)